MEWKQGIGRMAIQEAIVAFSNADGGVILVGVADDGSLVGKRFDDGVEKTLWEIVSELESPGRVDICGLTVGDVDLTAVSVDRGRQGVAQTSDGRPLIRRGKQNLPMKGDALLQAFSQRSPDSFDGAESKWTLEDADPALLAELRRALELDERLADDELAAALLAQNLVVRVGNRHVLTNAAALYLIPDAPATFGKCHVEVFRYREGEREYDRRLQFGGTPAQQVRDATEWLENELGRHLVVVGTTRYELTRLPTKAIREAVANAVAHRDYQLSGSAVEINLTRRELTVTSLGRFIEPVTSQNLLHAHAARNSRIIRLLRQFGLAEDAGRGIRVILDEMAADLLASPSFDEDVAGHVSVRLPIESPVSAEERAWVRQHGTDGKLRAEDRRVLIEAARAGDVTNADVRDLLDVDSRQARQSLQRLRDAGFLDQSGDRGGTRYRLASQIRPPAGVRISRRATKSIILSLADRVGEVTNALVRTETGLSRNEARSLLAELVEAGELELRGQRRGAHYVIPSPTDHGLDL